VTVGENAHLGVVGPKAYESKAFGLTRLGFLLDLGHQHFAKGLKVLPQAILSCLPGQAQNYKISASQTGLDPFGLGR